ncbi:MAG: site-specific DNA-methyltransferase [Bacteroidetes bacterium]|nr:site-specific DNA-methyltransferase [Bacteroidota bacterium]MCL5027243.1 site-specific DNA-methyltransferase [Chloroflexota bacterium]
MYPEDCAVHDWYRFVLSFPPHLVRSYLQRFEVNNHHTVLDPFCGTGTTLVECKKLGIPSVGIEANPVAHFASQVKTDWSPDSDGLFEHASYIAKEAKAELEADGIDDTPLFFDNSGRHATLRTLPPESFKLLLTDSISPLPLHKMLVLLDHIQRNRDERYYRHELLVLAKCLIVSASNLHFGPEVGVGTIKPDAPVISPWLAGIRDISHDLHTIRSDEETPASAYCADARRISETIEPNSIDAVITSPPYPNEKDYTRTTRLEAVLLGFIHNRAELQSMKKKLVRSNTRTVYKTDDDDQWISKDPEIQRIADAIESRRIQLGKTSGFERQYARVTKLYFGGMARHLAALRPVLRPGARLAYVVGDQASYLQVMIKTGQLLGSIAESLGYELTGIDLFRTRIATATKQQLREEVVVLRWPGPKIESHSSRALQSISIRDLQQRKLVETD